MKNNISNILEDSSISKYIDNNCRDNLKKRWNAVNLTYGTRYGAWSKLAGLIRRVFNVVLACIGCSDWQRAHRATTRALEERITALHPELPADQTKNLSKQFSKILLYTLIEGTKIYSKNPETRLARLEILKENTVYEWMKNNLPQEPKPIKPEPKHTEAPKVPEHTNTEDHATVLEPNNLPDIEEIQNNAPETPAIILPLPTNHDDAPTEFIPPRLERARAYRVLPTFNPNPEPLPNRQEIDHRVQELIAPPGDEDIDEDFDSDEDFTIYTEDELDDTVYDEELEEMFEDEQMLLAPGVPEPTVYAFEYKGDEYGTQRDHTYQVFKNLVPIVKKRAELLREEYHFAEPSEGDPLVYHRGYEFLQNGDQVSLSSLNTFMREAKAKIKELGDQRNPPQLYTLLSNMVNIFYLERMALLANNYQLGIHVHREDYKEATISPEHYRGWVGSQDTRDILSLADFKNKELDQAVLEYEFFADLLMAAPSNFRDHITEANGSADHLLRLGVISHMANAYTNLKELKEMAGDPELLARKVKALNKSMNSANKVQKVTIQYALNQLRSPKELERAIRERRTYLELQMLQLVQEQLNNSESNIGSTFTMMHLLLLTENNKAMDPENNWYKHEGNFMMDMAEIFREFEGATIHFEADCSAPYIRDIDGDKHLYFPQVADAPARTRLQPLFVNLAVQLRAGYKKEIKQRSIFSYWLLKLREYSGLRGEDAELKDLIRRFAKGESDYSLARDILIYARDKGYRCSTGCMSAKDRTGVLCDENAIMFTLQEHGLDKSAPQRTDWGKGMLKSGRPALEIAKQCGQAQREPIAVNGLKVLSPNLCSLTAGARGRLNRLYGYMKMIPV